MIYNIQCNFYKWVLDVINKHILGKQKIRKLERKIKKTIDSKMNLKYLDMKASDFFSQNISSIYRKVLTNKSGNGKEINKHVINDLLKGDDENIKNILNLTLQDFLNIYRYQENEDIIDRIGSKVLAEFNPRIDRFLNELYEKESKKNAKKAKGYISSILVMAFNYEAWFLSKKARNRSSNKNIQKIVKGKYYHRKQ